MPAELAAVLAFLVVAVVGFSIATLWILSAMRAPLTELTTKYKDALSAISARADQEAALATTALEQLGNFERAVGDKRSLEAAVKSLTEQTSYLQERLTEMQRANIALANPKAEQIIAAQTFRKDQKDEPYSPPPPRWAAANGDTNMPEPLVAELTRLNPSTTYKFRGADLVTMSTPESA